MSDKLLKKFLTKIASAKEDNRPYWGHNSYDKEKAITSLISFNKNEIRKIVSNNYWINYPTWSTSTNKKFGPAIYTIISIARTSYPKLFSLISRHGQGIWACYAMDFSSGKEKISLSKRNLYSKDKRVRLRASKSVPISVAKKLLQDSYYPVRNSALKRIGLENCYKELMNDPSHWIKNEALRHADLNDYNYKEELINRLENIKSAKLKNQYEPWSDLRAAESILSKMNKSDIIYYLDYFSYSDRLSSLAKDRLGSDWG